MSKKAFLEVTLVLLTLGARTVFKIFGKTQRISLYWFASQQQTSTSRRQKSDLFYRKLYPEFNELSLVFKKRQQVSEKWLKLKHSRKPHRCGIRCLRAKE